MRWWRREVNVPNLSSTEQSTVVLIKIIIWDAVLIWLNGSVFSKVFCVVAAPIWHIYFLTMHATSERQYLSFEAGYGIALGLFDPFISKGF